MARWFRTLDVTDLWQSSIPRGGTLTPQEIAKSVAERLERIPGDYELEDIKEAFVGLSEDTDADFDDLDNVYSDLCDWGDYNHRLWIKTF